MGIKYATYVLAVCKMGQGAKCCRYLIFNPGVGFECAKLQTEKITTLDRKLRGDELRLTPKEMIDLNVRMGHMTAQGDNCEGKNPIPDEAPDEDRPF